MTYMLDTNICIYALKGNAKIIATLRQHRNRGICISSIALAELHHGATNSATPEQNRSVLQDFLRSFSVITFDEDAAIEYGYVQTDLSRKGIRISPMDTLIAAHAKAAGLVLVTHNIREFIRVDGLQIEDWAE
jgi:tRNA(fMet)-specific endonuclease VapC